VIDGVKYERERLLRSTPRTRRKSLLLPIKMKQKRMARYLLLIHMMTLSLLLGDGTVQIELTNGLVFEEGEFIGTYMNHVHVLTGEKLYYYACDDIRSITSAPGETFEYDCSENTVTADILFPPELDPMTGEWAQKLPDVFNPDIVQPVAVEETDAVDTDPPTVDHGEIDPRFDDEVSTFEKKNITEEDFIMINGVKYVKAAPDKENDENSIDVISERITDVPTTQWLELSQHYELLKKQRKIFPIVALMAFPISEGILPHSIGPESVAVPIIIGSSVGYVYHQKKINNLQAKLQQRATKKQWDLYEEDRDRRVTKKKTHKKSEIQKISAVFNAVIEKVIVGCCVFQVIWLIGLGIL